MTLNQDTFSDEWGWFIDIDYEPKTKIGISNRKNLRVSILETIEEDNEYDYYKKTLRDLDIEELQNENIEPNIQKQKNYNFIYKVGSTTIITALLTYVAYFIL